MEGRLKTLNSNFYTEDCYSLPIPLKYVEEPSIEPNLPPWNSSQEIGYVVATAKEGVKIGEGSDSIICLVPAKYRKGLKIGTPLIIWDYLEGEMFGSIVSEISCPDITRDQLEIFLYEKFTPTQELIASNKMDFLEQAILIKAKLFCTINQFGEKGPVDYSPHPRSSVFYPPIVLVKKIFGLPSLEEGIAYGVLMLGRKPFFDKETGSFVPYVMRSHLLFTHEMVIGTTGKGKTAKCKNDVKQFADKIAGSVIILDKHGEYEKGLLEEPIFPKSDFEKKIWKDCGMIPGTVEDLKILRHETELPEDPDPQITYFTINFSDIKPHQLQYYLPNLSPQGYVVLPNLVKMFRTSRLKQTLATFYHWLKKTKIPENLADQRTISAILRRLVLTIEQKLFDGKNLSSIGPKDLLKPKRVTVLPLHHILDMDLLSSIAFYIIDMVSRWKLKPQNIEPPTIILIDEAHNYFPKFTSEERKDYVNRLVSRARIICREGRKFKLRLQFATQRPEELDPGVLGIVNTITFFGCTPQQVTSLKKVIELPFPPSQLVNLPMRNALIYARDNTEQPCKIFIPWPIVNHPTRSSS